MGGGEDMLAKYDINKLEGAIYDFNIATGVSVTLYDVEERPVTLRGTGSAGYCSLVASTKEGAKACTKSNRSLISRCRESKQPVRHICAAGLLDIAIPLLHRGEIVGFLMIGQIRKGELLPECTQAFPINREELNECYRALPLYNDQMIESIINIATMLTKYVMFENMVRSQQKQSAAALADYVEEHLTEKLTVESVSHGMHMSASGIYKCMRQSYNRTLCEYITERRIERAVKLLEDADLSIEEVAEAVGFTDAAYFSRRFKKSKGISPLKYRKQH